MRKSFTDAKGNAYTREVGYFTVYASFGGYQMVITKFDGTIDEKTIPTYAEFKEKIYDKFVADLTLNNNRLAYRPMLVQTEGAKIFEPRLRGTMVKDGLTWSVIIDHKASLMFFAKADCLGHAEVQFAQRPTITSSSPV